VTKTQTLNRYKKIVDTVEGHVYTDQEVNEMVRLRKERNKNEILNYGIEILQIQESLQLALEQQTQNEDDVELNQKIDGLRQRLKELEQQEKERRDKSQDPTVKKMHLINKKHIKQNTAIAREVAKKRLQKEKKGADKKKHDPFKRRETVVQNLWLSKPKKKNETNKKKKKTVTEESKKELDTASQILGVSKVLTTDIRSHITNVHSSEVISKERGVTTKRKKKKKKKKKKGISLSEWKKMNNKN
jgi:hypothetical protein